MRFINILMIMLLCVVMSPLIYLLSYFAKKYYENVYPAIINSGDSSVWGAFGDFFGGILNPIFGFVSLSLILITIWQQKKALSQTAKQINLSIEEMTKSVTAQEKQADLSEKQLTELMRKSIFDDSVRVLNSLIEDLNISINEELICYKNQNITRNLKSQLLELAKQNHKEQKNDFLQYNCYSYNNFFDIFKYSESVLANFKKVNNGVAYEYYKQKLSVFEKLLIRE